MNAVFPTPPKRGLDLLVAHCASLDPEAPSARDRLEAAVGAELAGKLVFALSATTGSARRERFAA